MITCTLQGGLGNQMFQIAATKALAWRNNDSALFDLNNHHLPLQGRKAINYTKNILRKVAFGTPPPSSKIYHEPYHHYIEIPYIDKMMLVGYFQSEKYFIDFSENIRELFSPDENTREYITQKYGEVLTDNTASIHIRRGDYLKFKDVHPAANKEYYVNAMNRLPPDTKYLIFSDDPTWCLSNFKMNQFRIIEGEEDYIDLYLMSECKNNIIANSSFSWWAAWLNSHLDKRVFVPQKWFGPAGPQDEQDLIPEGWERI